MRELETDRIMGGIGDVFVEKMMKKLLVTGINVQNVKVNEMESKTENSVITPDEEFQTNVKSWSVLTLS